MNALILFSHGSLLCGAGEALDAHAARLRDRGDYDMVEVGYLNYSEPLFAETVRKVVAAGATRIIVVPYFLVSGYFVSKSLPETLEPVQAEHPDVTFVVAEALGYDESLADALLESALTAKTAEHWQEPLTRAARSCRPHPDCPLYGTAACPKVPVLPEVTRG
jgi:sirohydrochlorin cobaltochelatase